MSANIRRIDGRRTGFTLVELLTVIAIIAILAGLLFPVIGTARENARKSACMSNLHHLIQALNIYRDDHRVFPDALLAISYDMGATSQTRLYPEYVKDLKTFVCPNSYVQAPSGGGTGQMVDAVNRTTGMTTPYLLSAFSSYDFQYRPNSAQPNTIRELRYTRKWTGLVPGLGDDPRQLIYREPPDNTIVTWCLYHTSMDLNGNPSKDHTAVVAYRDGRVQTIPADKFAVWPAECTNPNQFPVNCPWQVPPKP